MDTTLRDGEQTSGVSFSVAEKLALSKLLLDELKVDRIEIASARVSEGELKAVKEVTQWAQSKKYQNRRRLPENESLPESKVRSLQLG